MNRNAILLICLFILSFMATGECSGQALNILQDDSQIDAELKRLEETLTDQISSIDCRPQLKDLETELLRLEVALKSASQSQSTKATNRITQLESQFDSAQKDLRSAIQSGHSRTEGIIANLKTDLATLSGSLDELKNKKKDWGPLVVSLLAVIVSALAVVLGTHMQNRTIEMERENTVTTVRASKLKDWIEGLQETLAEFMNVTYNVSFFYASAMRNNEPWPGDKHWELVQKEDILHNDLQLRLDPSRKTHDDLLHALKQLRDHENALEVNAYRASVLDAARQVFQYEWSVIAGENDD